MAEVVATALLVLTTASVCWSALRLSASWWRHARDRWPAVRRLLGRRQGSALDPARGATLLVQIGLVAGAAVAIAVTGAAVLPALVAMHVLLALVALAATAPGRPRLLLGPAGTVALLVQLLWLGWCATWAGPGGHLVAAAAALLGGLACGAGREAVLGRIARTVLELPA